MAISSDKDAIKLGFWIAVGFFAFSLIIGVVQFIFMKARKANG